MNASELGLPHRCILAGALRPRAVPRCVPPGDGKGEPRERDFGFLPGVPPEPRRTVVSGDLLRMNGLSDFARPTRQCLQRLVAELALPAEWVARAAGVRATTAS